MTTFAELSQRERLFERSALMPRPARARAVPGEDPVILVERNATVSLHPQLSPTPVWTYAGQFPGPVIEVDAGSRVDVVVHNELAGSIPFAHVVVDTASGGSMNDAGSERASEADADLTEAANVAALDAWTVLHLHGAPTDADSDGWTENVIGLGQRRRRSYEFPRERWTLQPAHALSARELRSGAAPMYWYHDHAMAATRFTVYAGLAGTLLVRDLLETQLGLPVDPELEIPLLLMDRGLATADDRADGALTGALLHKVETETRECFAPVNLVNGLAWPRIAVTPRVHRLRIVNGANARTYRLHFLAVDGPSAGAAVGADAVQQIGTDGGLLGHAVDLPFGSLTLSPGERADVLVDFGWLASTGVTRVDVLTSAPAPFGGDPSSAVGDPRTADPAAYLPVPEVMRFEISPGTAQSGIVDAAGTRRPIAGLPLDPAFTRIGSAGTDLPLGHGETLVALREEGGMLYLHELVEEEYANLHSLNLYAATTSGMRQGIRLTLPDRAGRGLCHRRQALHGFCGHDDRARQLARLPCHQSQPGYAPVPHPSHSVPIAAAPLSRYRCRAGGLERGDRIQLRGRLTRGPGHDRRQRGGLEGHLPRQPR